MALGAAALAIIRGAIMVQIRFLFPSIRNCKKVCAAVAAAVGFPRQLDCVHRQKPELQTNPELYQGL